MPYGPKEAQGAVGGSTSIASTAVIARGVWGWRWGLLVVVPLLVLTALTAAVVVQWAPLLAADRSIEDVVGAARPPDTGGWVVMTWLGTGPRLTLVGAAGAVVLAVRRQWATCWALLAAMGAVFACWAILRVTVTRPRPDGGLVPAASDLGYPSGHATNSAAAALLTVLVLGPALHRRGRIALAVGAAAFALIVGLSRIVLGVHHPSDVLAGWALALVVVGTVYPAVRALVERRTAPHEREP